MRIPRLPVTGSFILCLSFNRKHMEPSIRSMNCNGRCFFESTSQISSWFICRCAFLNPSSKFNLWPGEESAERPSVYVERSRWVWDEYEERMRRYTARTVLVHLCELLLRPKVSLRSLILRSNNSVAQLSRRLGEKIYTPLWESTCLIARVLLGCGRIDCRTD